MCTVPSLDYPRGRSTKMWLHVLTRKIDPAPLFSTQIEALLLEFAFGATLLTLVSKLPAETDGVGAAPTGPKCDPLYPRQSTSTYFIGSCHLTSVEKCVVETTFSVQTWKSTRYNFKLSVSIMHPRFHICSHMSKLGCTLNVEKFILKWRISCALEDKILVI